MGRHGSGKGIFTYVTIDAQQYIKGSGNWTVVIRVPGGQVDGITQVVSDTPSFTLGEKTIVFLQQKDFPVVGWHQGKFTVVGDTIAGLGAKVNDFIGMIQLIQHESGTNPPASPTISGGVADAGQKAPETPGIGTPRHAVLPQRLEKPEPAKESDDGRQRPRCGGCPAGCQRRLDYHPKRGIRRHLARGLMECVRKTRLGMMTTSSPHGPSERLVRQRGVGPGPSIL